MYSISFESLGLVAYLVSEKPGAIEWVFTQEAASHFTQEEAETICRTISSRDSYRNGKLQLVEFQDFMYLVLDKDWQPQFLSMSKRKSYNAGKKIPNAKIQKVYLDDESMQRSEIVYEFGE